MSVFPIKNDVINAVIAGIENAKRNYTFGLQTSYIYHMLHQSF